MSNNTCGRFSVNVWPRNYKGGLGVCWNIDGRLNARKCIEILENVMLPSVRETLANNDFIFQLNKCSVHTAHCINNYFAEHNIESIPWATKSRNINPLENDLGNHG